MSTDTRKYEVFYIAPTTLSEEDLNKVIDHWKEVVTKNGGEVDSAALWDKRKLAYEIKDQKEGNYVLMTFNAPPAVPNELNRLMRINDNVLRHRIDRLDE